MKHPFGRAGKWYFTTVNRSWRRCGHSVTITRERPSARRVSLDDIGEDCPVCRGRWRKAK